LLENIFKKSLFISCFIEMNAYLCHGYLFKAQNRMKISIKTHGASINHLAWGAIRRFKANGKTLTWKQAFAFAVDALNVKDRMATGVVEFSFVKVSTGEVRAAKGTRELSNIPSEFHPKGTSTKSETTNVVSYFDLGVQGWRSFDISTLIPSLV
jgi:hypothetical protein